MKSVVSSLLLILSRNWCIIWSEFAKSSLGKLSCKYYSSNSVKIEDLAGWNGMMLDYPEILGVLNVQRCKMYLT